MICRYCNGIMVDHKRTFPHIVLDYQFCPSCKIAIKPHTENYDLNDRKVLESFGHMDFGNIALQYLHVANRVHELKRTGSLLDYGCATGSVMKLMEALGYCVRGFDICPEALKVCKERGLNASSDLSVHGKYDVIWSSETIEHLPEPLDFMDFARDHIEHGGVVYIQTQQPALNGESYGLAYQPAHTVLMCPEFLEKQMEKRGFELIEGGENNLGCYWRYFRGK